MRARRLAWKTYERSHRRQLPEGCNRFAQIRSAWILVPKGFARALLHNGDDRGLRTVCITAPCGPQKAIAESKFRAILNEKDPDPPKVAIVPPKPLRGRIVSDEVFNLRSHADVRVARRAQTIAKLAQVISERDIQKHGGLRRVLLVQSQRLEALASERYNSLGGESARRTRL